MTRVEVAEDRVDVVRDEQDGDVLLAADVAHERRDAGLVGEVETVERLVEQQQLRATHERLRDQQALLLAAGELADRLVRIGGRRDELDHFRDAARCRAAARARERHAPARTVEPEPDDVDAADARALVEASSLRQVADMRVRLARRRPSTVALPAASGSNPSTARMSVDFPDPFGPRTATNWPRSTVSETSRQIVVRRCAPRRPRT